MKKTEIRYSIKSVYEDLWDVLALYEPTECYNIVPESEKMQDAWNYMGEKLLKIRKKVNTLFLGEEQLAGKMQQIVDETEHFVRSYERPGTKTRWKKINTNLLFFDAAFTIMEDAPDTYKAICRGLTDIRFSCYPDEELIKARELYFKRVKEKNEKDNFRYSEERIFQNELHRTLTMVFEHDFADYL